ncbi:MAG: hypothetical protein AABN34_00605 [Acidobacteriota bacterium]
METIKAAWFWLASWGLVGLCILAVVGLCWKCGFPIKHRTPPSVDCIVIAVLGTAGVYSGINLLNSARSMSSSDSNRVPIIVAAFVLIFVGISGLVRGFNKAISESPLPAKKEEEPPEDSK